MSNFKSNNRFNFLDGTESQDKKRNEYSKRDFDNKPKYQTYNKFKNEDKYIPPKKDFQMKENEFPELPPSDLVNKTSNIEQPLVTSGWSSYKFDNTQFKLNEPFTTSPMSKPTHTISKNEKENEINKNVNEAEEIIEALSFLHEKRTEEYIKLWGEEEWERMFIFPNHDYEYFDKLDEIYEIEQNKINEQYSNLNYDSYGENYYDDEI
jgi:hypothetical protein